MKPNQITAHNAGGPSQFRFAVRGLWSGVCEFWRWAIAVRSIIAAFVLTAMAATTYAAENAYDFTVTSQSGEVLGSGKISLPFKFGADGKGTADWQFTPTQIGSTNKYWAKAKARLASGRGKASAECKDSWFTLDFNPGWNDNNVTVSWDLKNRESGNLYFADFSGGHPCASFRILKPAQRDGPANGSQPSRSETNRTPPTADSRR